MQAYPSSCLCSLTLSLFLDYLQGIWLAIDCLALIFKLGEQQQQKLTLTCLFNIFTFVCCFRRSLEALTIFMAFTCCCCCYCCSLYCCFPGPCVCVCLCVKISLLSQTNKIYNVWKIWRSLRERERQRERAKKREINRENANISMEGENKKRESEKKTK